MPALIVHNGVEDDAPAFTTSTPTITLTTANAVMDMVYAVCYLGMVTVVLNNLTDWCYGLLSSLLLTFSF